MGGKIPVIETVRQAFQLLRTEGHRILVVGAAVALWMALQQVLIIKMGQDVSSPNKLRLLYLFPLSFLSSVVILPLITSAHRIVLQWEGGRTGWGFRREEWVYFLGWLRLFVPILVASLICGVIIVLTAIISRNSHVGFLMAPLRIVLVAALILVMCNYMLILPAAAIGKKLPLRRSSKLLKGNNLRLILAFAMVQTPGWLINFGLNRLGADFWMFKAALTGVVSTFSAVLFAFLLSLAYRRLAPWEMLP